MNRKYIDDVFGTIKIDDITEIRVLVSTEIDSGNKLVDIRKFRLYGNQYDNIKRYTKQGIKFKPINIPKIIYGLLDIMVSCKTIDKDKCNILKSQISNCINN